MSANSARRILFSGLFLLAITSLVRLPANAQETGESLFKSKCAMCHGPDASGNTSMGKALKVPDLHSDQVQKMSDAELTTAITKGKGKMPAYAGKLSKEQIEKLVAYIRGLSKH